MASQKFRLQRFTGRLDAYLSNHPKRLGPHMDGDTELRGRIYLFRHSIDDEGPIRLVGAKHGAEEDELLQPKDNDKIIRLLESNRDLLVFPRIFWTIVESSGFVATPEFIDSMLADLRSDPELSRLGIVATPEFVIALLADMQENPDILGVHGSAGAVAVYRLEDSLRPFEKRVTLGTLLDESNPEIISLEAEFNAHMQAVRREDAGLLRESDVEQTEEVKPGKN